MVLLYLEYILYSVRQHHNFALNLLRVSHLEIQWQNLNRSCSNIIGEYDTSFCQIRTIVWEELNPKS